MSPVVRGPQPGDRVRCVVDIAAATTLLVCLLPVGAAIACAVSIETRAWPIFQQERVGYRHRLFVMYKFRSMRPGSEDARRKVRGDPCITRTGYFLRRSSLDELPQAWNLLIGNMTLVGPRPELPWQTSLYRPEHFRRFGVLPGLTGLWQVNGRSELSLEEKLALDLDYVDSRSLWLDFKILARTPIAVLRGHGAF